MDGPGFEGLCSTSDSVCLDASLLAGDGPVIGGAASGELTVGVLPKGLLPRPNIGRFVASDVGGERAFSVAPRWADSDDSRGGEGSS